MKHSQMFSSKAAKHIRSNSSDNIPMVQINNAYHHIMLDQPLAFSAAIDAVLQGFDLSIRGNELTLIIEVAFRLDKILQALYNVAI